MQSQPGLKFKLLIEGQKTGVQMKIFIRQNEYVDGITQQSFTRDSQHLFVFWMREGVQMRVIRMLRTHGSLSKLNLSDLFTLLIIKNHRSATIRIENQFIRDARIGFSAIHIGAVDTVDIEDIGNHLRDRFK